MIFTLTINVAARDVVDGRIGAGRFGVTLARQVSSAPVRINQLTMSGVIGQPLTVTDVAVPTVAITVEASDYTRESTVCSFDDGRQAWVSTNPHVVVAGTKGDMAIVARLGCLRFAPLKSMPDTAPVKPDFNPVATLIEARGADFAYRGLWLDKLYLARLSDPIGGTKTAVDWKRFAHEKPTLAAKDSGTFAVLEFGFPAPNVTGRPRFLVGVWYPNSQLGDVADVNVFFSPNTGPPYPADSYPFAKGYPYEMLPKDGRKGPKYTLDDLDQPYVGLAINYVCVGYKIIYQMLAAGKNSIIVMPIQPASQWGPLQTRSCLWRLVLEVVRFGEAQRLIARQGAVGRLELRREGASVNSDAAGPAAMPFARPQIRFTTSAFSAGLGAILSLIATAKLADDKPYPVSHFAAPDDECAAAWKALWDIDGGFYQLSGMEACVQPMLNWRKGGSGRVLRMYHSEDTCSSSAPLAVLAPEVAVKRWNGSVGFVDQGYSSDQSTLWVLFSNQMLRAKSPADEAAMVWPTFGTQDAHHMVPTVAFGHAWLIA